MGIGVIAFVAIIIVAFIVVFILKNLEWWGTKKEWENPYKVKPYFFSIAEKEFYTNLKKILTDNYWNKYTIFPKVRLADIFEPINEEQWYKKLRMRHIDFLITDSTQAFKPVLAIELDWEYHKQYTQYKSDQFKNEIFKCSPISLIRFNNSTSSNAEVIRMNITQYLGTPVKN